MKHLRSPSSLVSTVLLALGPGLVACTGGPGEGATLHATSADVTGSDSATSSSLETPEKLPDGVIAVLKDVGVESLAADGTTLYLGTNDGRVLSLPKAGGATTTLIGSDVGGATDKSSVAVDGDYVYASNLWDAQIVRVPKTGGKIEVIADHLIDPGVMVMDATYVYVVAGDGNAPPGRGIVRFPKAGGSVETVAANQGLLTALTLGADDVFFAKGYDDAAGEIRRVAKAGGDVKTIATGIDTRSRPATPFQGWAVSRLVVAGDKVAFVEPSTGQLALAPIGGGEVTVTPALGLSQGALAWDGTSVLGFTYSNESGAATLSSFGISGALSTLATWTYANPRPEMPGGVDPAIALVLEPGRVIWVDSDIDVNPVTTIRTAALGAAPCGSDMNGPGGASPVR
jgi:hypothetical protein